MERIVGIEPTFSVWKTDVLTVKHNIRIVWVLCGFEQPIHQNVLAGIEPDFNDR